jgi:hypothetical protein
MDQTSEQNRLTTIRLINEQQTTSQRIRKLVGEAGEMTASACQWLDESRSGALQATLGEIADLRLVLDTLFARPDIGHLLESKLERRYVKLRTRLDAGEFKGEIKT